MAADGAHAGRSAPQSRIETLSDGVFAIALTLLTLNVHLTLASHETFAHAFRETLPQLFAYALSFTVIAMFWIGHHRLFASLARIDRDLVIVNFVYLATVALIPFPSQVLGSNGSEAGAALLYATVLAIGGLTSAFTWQLARHRGLLDPSIPGPLVLHSEWRSLTLVIVFALSIPIAVFAGASWAERSWALIIPARLLLRQRFGSVRDMSW